MLENPGLWLLPAHCAHVTHGSEPAVSRAHRKSQFFWRIIRQRQRLMLFKLNHNNLVLFLIKCKYCSIAFFPFTQRTPLFPLFSIIRSQRDCRVACSNFSLPTNLSPFRGSTNKLQLCNYRTQESPRAAFLYSMYSQDRPLEILLQHLFFLSGV